MTQMTGNMDDFGIDAASMTGPLEAKLKGAAQAGFAQVMLYAEDLVGHPDGVDAAVAKVCASGLRVTALRSLRDYEGLDGAAHDFKMDVTKSLLTLCDAIRCKQLLVQASALPGARNDSVSLAADLRKIAMLAIPKGIRVVYCASVDARCVTDFGKAWDLVCEADMPNLGLGLAADTVLEFIGQTPLDDLEMLDMDRLFLVQLCDFLGEPAKHPSGKTASALCRVFPGEGLHRDLVASMVTRLHALGYRGDYSLDVHNPDYGLMPLQEVAQRAKRAAVWLGERVLERSVPLPNSMRLKKLMTA